MMMVGLDMMKRLSIIKKIKGSQWKRLSKNGR